MAVACGQLRRLVLCASLPSHHRLQNPISKSAYWDCLRNREGQRENKKLEKNEGSNSVECIAIVTTAALISVRWPSLPGRRSSCSPCAKWHLWPKAQCPCSSIKLPCIVCVVQELVKNSSLLLRFHGIIRAWLRFVEALSLLSQNLHQSSRLGRFAHRLIP